MPTENRRVAAYLPKSIDDRLEAFKAERGLRGDSQALTTILAEFFQVSQEVVYQSSSSTQLEEQIELLRSELLDELKSELVKSQAAIEHRLQKLEEKATLLLPPTLQFELPSEPEEESPVQQEVPGQLRLIPTEEICDHQVDELQNELEDELLNESISELPAVEGIFSGERLPSSSSGKPLDGSAVWLGVELSKRLKMSPPVISARQKRGSKQFADWTRSNDPDRIAWKRVAKGYLPIVEVPAEEEEF